MSTLFFTTATEAFDNYPRGKIPELDSDIQLLDILQLVVHCRKKLALTSTTNGFAWFRLEAVIATAPEIWDNYVAWYFSEYDVDPLSLLESDAPSPPRPVPSQVISDRVDSLDSNHRLPASPYGSTDITAVYSAAILSGNLQALKHDWLAFLDDSDCVKSHQKLELKVSLLRYWLRFKSIISFQKLKKFIFLTSQRAVARSWSSWRNQTTKSTSIRSIQSAILLSLVQSAFSALRDFGCTARQSTFMRISIRQMTVIRALSSWRSQTVVFRALRKASIYFRLFCSEIVVGTFQKLTLLVLQIIFEQ